MTTHPAYKLVDDDDATVGTIWWTGSKLCASTPAILDRLKHKLVDGLDIRSGEKFFNRIPQVYKSGYISAHKTTVDDEGKEV